MSSEMIAELVVKMIFIVAVTLMVVALVWRYVAEFRRERKSRVKKQKGITNA